VGVLQRFERRLGRMVEGAFARAFKSEVQPVEVAATLQRELDDQAAVVGRDRTLVPNHLVVELGNHDYDRLAPYQAPLTHELAEMVREHAADQRYTFVGPVVVELKHVPELDTGVFRVHSDVAPGPEAANLQAHNPERGPAPDDTAYTTAIPRALVTTSFGRVRVREGKNAAYDYELRNPITVFGRGTDTDVRLTDSSVSRRHAEIRSANGATRLTDLQSTNGTTVNGEAVTSAALNDGDEIRLGEASITFHAPATLPPAPAARAVDQGPRG
jgi:pSer/pThr/pTyr-binding forkhead associated (FHA) protein